jgi:hypothetical protein
MLTFMAVLLITTVIAPAAHAGTQAKLTPGEARELAKEAWLFGLPLVMFEKQFDYSTYASKPEETRAPVNQFVHSSGRLH